MKDIWSVFPVENGEVNIWAWDITEFKQAVKRPMSLFAFTEAYVGRWDLLAENLYNDSYLWWVIPIENDIMDLFNPQLVGEFLSVPAYEDVWEFLEF
jgi:hypothetical protein